MIKKANKLLLIALTFVFFQNLSFAHTTTTVSSEQVDDFYTEITVNVDGTISVTENINYNLGQNERHGIFRNIPYKKTNADGKSFKMDIDVVSVEDELGTAYRYETSSGNGQISIKIGDANEHVTGVKTYIISYIVSGALTYFSEQTELYWNLTGNDWEIPILRSSANINLPKEINDSLTNAVCYTGIKDSTEKSCEHSAEANTYSLVSSKPLQPGEGLTVVIGFPPDWVDILEPKPDNSWLLSYIFGLLFVIAGLYWFILLPIIIFNKRYKIRKYFKDNQKVVAAWFDPPKNDVRNSYTPAETGILIDKRPDHKEVTATIIHLAQRGFLKIVEQEVSGFLGKTNETVFVKLKEYKTDVDLKEFEFLILDGLFSTKDTISTKELKKSTKFGENIVKFMTEVENSLEKHNLFDTDFSNAKNINSALLVFGAFTFNLPLLLVLLIMRHHYIKFNNVGIQKFSETASLYNFLISQSEQLDFQSKNQMFFEKLLPYATAFGAERIWAEKFKDLEFTKTDWYDGGLNNSLAFTSLSYNIGSSVQSSQSYTSSKSSSGFSSGFSGGSSGGGGGGGGGGSW